jgi:hypothetical protein
MKYLIFFVIFTFIGISGYSQNYTQKYNPLYDRTEFFDSNGNLVAYAKENSLYNRTEYCENSNVDY